LSGTPNKHHNPCGGGCCGGGCGDELNAIPPRAAHHRLPDLNHDDDDISIEHTKPKPHQHHHRHNYRQSHLSLSTDAIINSPASKTSASTSITNSDDVEGGGGEGGTSPTNPNPNPPSSAEEKKKKLKRPLSTILNREQDDTVPFPSPPAPSAVHHRAGSEVRVDVDYAMTRSSRGVDDGGSDGVKMGNSVVIGGGVGLGVGGMGSGRGRGLGWRKAVGGR
jgi:hypothetical protein